MYTIKLTTDGWSLLIGNYALFNGLDSAMLDCILAMLTSACCLNWTNHHPYTGELESCVTE